MPKKLELESALEQRCVDKIEARGGLALKLAVPGTRGFPDRTFMLPGSTIMGDHSKVFFCEFKRQKVGVVSAQQATWRRMFTLLGFGVYMVETDEQFDEALARELGR